MAKGSVFSVVKGAIKDFGEDECSVRAAALAYYTIFALPPLLVLLITIAGLVWDPGDVQRSLEGQFSGMLGAKAGGQIHEMLRSADRPDTGGVLSTTLSIAGLLFGATGAFLQLQGALNRAWEVKPDPSQGGVMRFVTKRLLSIGMVLVIAFLLSVSLAFTAFISAVAGRIGGSIAEPAMYALDLTLALIFLTLLFGLIFKILPDAKMDWRDVWFGAGVTAVLFVIGKFAIGYYLGRGDKGDAFGAAGALAVVLLWIYYAGMILLFGAEFTQRWAERNGRGIRPEDGAVKVIEKQIVVPNPSSPPEEPTGKTDVRRGESSAAATSSGKGALLLGAALLMLRLVGRAKERSK